MGDRSRAAVEARLDRLVRENRFTIAVVFPLVGAALLLASAEGLLPGPLAFNPFLLLAGTLVMRLPLVAGLAPLVDRRAAAGLGLLAAYAYAVELVGVRTGLPYGEFGYLVDQGPMLLGEVPLGLPVFFFPLVVNSYLLVLLLLGDQRVASRPSSSPCWRWTSCSTRGPWRSGSGPTPTAATTASRSRTTSAGR